VTSGEPVLAVHPVTYLLCHSSIVMSIYLSVYLAVHD